MPLSAPQRGDAVTGRYRAIVASEPGAPPECRLTREEGLRRQSDTDGLFARLSGQRSMDSGHEFLFKGDPGTLWDMVSLFVDEEAVCCPFITFEQTETEDGVALVVVPQGG